MAVAERRVPRNLIYRPRLAASVAAVGLVTALLASDRLPRFYQGDSIAYFATGLSGWIPPDRSWAYGFGARWLVTATHAVSSLPVAQAVLLLGAVLSMLGTFADRRAGRVGAIVFAVAAALDPLNETYARFWLSDAPGAAAFIAFVALAAAVPAASSGRFRVMLAPMAACVFVSVFVRIAYAPIEIATLLIAAAGASWRSKHDRPHALRRRLLALSILPVMALGVVAAANSQVAIPALRGQPFVNRMSSLYTMGVFLPALSRDDFERAGVPLTPDEFGRLALDRYDSREGQIWNDGPQYVRWLMQRKLGIDETYDARFQKACAAVVRSALLHHPQSLLFVYARSLLLYFDPREWSGMFSGEMGFGHPLPDWVANNLTDITGRTVSPAITDLPSPLVAALGATISLYPVLLIVGAASAGVILARVRKFDAQHIVSAALLASLLVAPLFSHAVKPRYVLATVTLSELLLALALCHAAAISAAVRRAAGLLKTPVLPAAAGVLCVAAFAGQLGLGRWQADELELFSQQRDWGLRVLESRLLYSPRPFSEGLLFLYGKAVLAFSQPFIIPFLAVIWVAVLGTGMLAARSALPPSRNRTSAAVGLVTVLFAFVLSTSSITETFYWPMAAAAYLPVFASAVVLTFLLGRPLDAARRRWCGAALLVAAMSCEIGAAMAIGFSCASAVEAMSRPRPAGRPRRLATMAREGWWWLVPGLCGIAVLVVIASLRLNVVELGAKAHPFEGSAASLVWTTLLRIARDLAGAGDTGGALAARLLLAVGFAAVWRQAGSGADKPGRWHAVLAASLVFAACFSVAASYYHYNELCCERQSTMRLWMNDLLFVLAASRMLAWLGSTRPDWRVLRSAGWLPPLLLALSLFPILSRLDGLRQDYDMTGLAAEGRAKTWRAGQRAGTDRMEFYLPPDGSGMLIRGTSQPIGTFERGEGTPEMVAAVGRFFGKAVVTTCQPWQISQSLLVNGQFIPACPPHEGPPDVTYPSPP